MNQVFKYNRKDLSNTNMKPQLKLLISLFLLLNLSGSNIHSQTLDQILEKHYAAMGIENLKDVNSIKYYGYYKNHYLKKISKDLPQNLFQPDIELSVIKQSKYHLKITDIQGDHLYGFPSNKYWNKPVHTSAVKWNPIPIDRLWIQLYLDFEGFLYHPKEKGIQIEEVYNITFKKKPYHCLQAITPEKDTLYYYINPENFLLDKISFGEMLKDDEQQIFIAFDDFKTIEGVKIAFRKIYNIQTLDGSYGKREEIFKKVEINPELDMTVFEFQNQNNL